MNYGKATKKPVTVHFYKWDNKLDDLRNWIFSNGEIPNENIIQVKNEKNVITGDIQISTLEGTSYDVPLGYIIIRGIDGEYYPCDPDIFNRTYNLETLHTED